MQLGVSLLVQGINLDEVESRIVMSALTDDFLPGQRVSFIGYAVYCCALLPDRDSTRYTVFSVAQVGKTS
jgi:hypothetical protein